LLCLQHFTGTLDNWDPAVTDPLAFGREVILFENAGIAVERRCTGDGGRNDRARVGVLDGLGLTKCDVLGFSLAA